MERKLKLLKVDREIERVFLILMTNKGNFYIDTNVNSETEFRIFKGYPLEDNSNIVNNYYTESEIINEFLRYCKLREDNGYNYYLGYRDIRNFYINRMKNIVFTDEYFKNNKDLLIDSSDSDEISEIKKIKYDKHLLEVNIQKLVTEFYLKYKVHEINIKSETITLDTNFSEDKTYIQVSVSVTI